PYSYTAPFPTRRSSDLGRLEGVCLRRQSPLQSYCLCALRWNPPAQIIWQRRVNPITAIAQNANLAAGRQRQNAVRIIRGRDASRSEEHTSELQSPDHLV